MRLRPSATGKPEWDDGPSYKAPVSEAIPPVVGESRRVNPTKVVNRLYKDAAAMEARKAQQREKMLEEAKFSQPFKPLLPAPRSPS
eukprot:COSAG04_NODE_21897_length_365_cov_0.635338_1_plen_85_part_01